MPRSLTDSQLPLLTYNNNNMNTANIPIWKLWIKPFNLITLSWMVSIITSPIVAITNYWKKTTKFEFINGWNDFIMSPTTFISSELINSFFYSLAFLKIEFCLDTILNDSLSKKDKLKKVSKNNMLVISLLFINEISKNMIYNQLNTEEIWISLAKDFVFNLGKEIVIVIVWKIFKNCLINVRNCFTNNRNFSNYCNPISIMILLGIAYIGMNVGQTLYIIWNSSISDFFMPNFLAIFTSNSITASFRIISNSLLTYFFSDIIKKWKNGLCKKPSQEKIDSFQEVVGNGITRTYNTFGDTTTLKLKHSISYDSFFNIQEVNKIGEQDFVINNIQKPNFMTM